MQSGDHRPVGQPALEGHWLFVGDEGEGRRRIVGRTLRACNDLGPRARRRSHRSPGYAVVRIRLDDILAIANDRVRSRAADVDLVAGRRIRVAVSPSMWSGPSPPVSTSAPARPKTCDATVMRERNLVVHVADVDVHRGDAWARGRVGSDCRAAAARGVSATLSVTVKESPDCVTVRMFVSLTALYRSCPPVTETVEPIAGSTRTNPGRAQHPGGLPGVLPSTEHAKARPIPAYCAYIPSAE